MLTLESLKEYGADVASGLLRCANNESLYIRLVGICINELNDPSLGDALKEGNYDRAFEAAHKLKGGVNNLELTPISIPLNELTELLRNKTPGDYDKLYNDIVNETAKLSELIK